MEKRFMATLSRSQGRSAWAVIFRHPVRVDPNTGKLTENARGRVAQEEDSRAVPGPRQSRHTIIMFRRQRPAALDRNVAHDDFALRGRSGDPTAVARESQAVQGDRQRPFLPAFEIAYSRMLHESAFQG